MRFVGWVAVLLLVTSSVYAAKPSFGLQDAIKGAFWVFQRQLMQNDPLLIGRNFVELLGQKLFIGSASLSGQSSLSLDDLSVNDVAGDAFGIMSVNQLKATINEVAIDAFIVNFGLRFTELTLENSTISWRFTYNNSTKQVTSLNVLPKFGSIVGRVAVDLGGRVFEKTFTDKNAVDAINNMFAKNSPKISSDLMTLVNMGLRFYNTPTTTTVSYPPSIGQPPLSNPLK